jgi:hypothetical protein
MSAERDIIIERLEQKLAAKDREFEQMQKSLRDTIIEEIEKRFEDKLKLREATIDDIKMKLGQKVNDITEERINKLERRLVELNSAYEGVMKELLDQKSIIHELKPYKIHEKQKEDAKPRVEEKQPEKPKPKGEYIVADNYVPRDKRKQQVIIEAEDKAENKTKFSDNKAEQEQLINKPMFKRSKRESEGVEIYENPKRGR